LSAPINSLSEIVFSDHTLDEVSAHAAGVGLASMPGWYAAAVTWVEKDKVTTFGTTDPAVQTVDQAQYDAGTGPCVDSSRGGKVNVYDAERPKPRWKNFDAAAKDAGILSVASFPLKMGDQPVGALNFYSREAKALSDGDVEEGLFIAGQVSVTLANAKAAATTTELVGHLHEALETRTLIGQATGLLMAQEGLTSEEAFQKLVALSQKSNVKLKVIAGRYVGHWDEKAAPKGPV
jgi:GAF domain-containing protein